MKLTPPKQYQQGYTEFYKLKFKLTPDVLIPRPETELIVDEVLSVLRSDPGQTLIDVGTGSGCIAIAVAKNNPKVKVIGIDISEPALKMAEQNANFHHVKSRVFLVKNDLLAGFKQAPTIITANLPYIPTARLMHIDPMVTEFEPRLALDGGYDGFELYRTLLSQIKEQQIEPKLFIGEIDSEQAEVARNFAAKLFPQAKVDIKPDLAKKDRFLIISF